MPESQREARARLDSTILDQNAELEVVSADFGEQRTQIRAIVQSKHEEEDALPPFDTLPDEVVIKIFEAAHTHDFPHCRLHSGRVQDSAVTISHVNRRWRRISLDIPSIWACLHITLQQGARHPSALTEFIERSRQRPLSVMFIYHTDRAGSTQNPWDIVRPRWPQFKLCWRVILRVRRRIQNLAVFCGDLTSIAYIQASLQGVKFPILAFLGLFIHFRLDADRLDDRLDIQAPLLTHLRIHVVPLISNFSLYAGLTELVLDNFGSFRSDEASIFDAISRASPTLEKLAIRILHFGTEGITDTFPSFTFPRLRQLCLYDCRSESADLNTPLERTVQRKLLSRAPILETLYCCEDDCLLWELEKAPFALARLRTFVFNSSDWQQPEPEEIYPSAQVWSALVESMPTVENIQLYAKGGMGLLRTIVQLTNPLVWPSLHNVDVPIKGADDVDHLMLFLLHRSTVGLPIRTLAVFAESADAEQLLRARLPHHPNLTVEVEWRAKPAELDIANPWDKETDRPTFGL